MLNLSFNLSDIVISKIAHVVKINLSDLFVFKFNFGAFFLLLTFEGTVEQQSKMKLALGANLAVLDLQLLTI